MESVYTCMPFDYVLSTIASIYSMVYNIMSVFCRLQIGKALSRCSDEGLDGVRSSLEHQTHEMAFGILEFLHILNYCKYNYFTYVSFMFINAQLLASSKLQF